MNTPKKHRVYDARVNRPQRNQVQMHLFSLEQLLPLEDRARLVWEYVRQLDLEPLYAKIEAVPGTVGRNAIAPEILMALWLLATLDSISSARELTRRTENQIPYMWICGGVSVNHHTLSDFRSTNGAFFEQVLVDSVTAMLQQGFVTLETLAQDGMRVRASAGSSSFRRQPTLEKLHEQAQEHVKKLQEESEEERQESDARRQAARQRAAREREERIQKSLEEVEKLRQQKEARRKGDGPKARASITDPEARSMKMGDGGFRPAYNFQFATDAASRMIVGVDVINSGNDQGQMSPMLEQVTQTYGKQPQYILVDSPFATKEEVTTVERRGTKVVSTIAGATKMKKHGTDPHQKQSRDTEEYGAFRKRMGEPEYQALYKQRPSIAEFPNAECRNRGCRLLRVRGLLKVKATALLYAVAFNFMRMMHQKAVT